MARGWLEFWVLELDGVIAAAQFAFRYRDTVFQLQEGNDPNRSSDRVGVVLRGHVLRHLISEGVRTYDFLGGEPGYKARWGAERRYYLDIKLARPFTSGGAYLRAVHETARSKAWLRESLPPSAWKVLYQMKGYLRGGSGQGPKSVSE
jgi:CelD/BcsL family acetyltransferase involved in cellulose biosynthesis